MFVYCFKGQNIKLYASIAVSLLSVILVIAFVPPASSSAEETGSLAVGVTAVEPSFKNVETNEDRIAFLAQYGWECESAPAEVEEWTVPVTSDPVYEKYNEMLKAEGLDLTDFKGKNVKKYRYVITNHEHKGTVYATLILYRDRVIGGDLSSATGQAFTHGFTKENAFPE